MSTYEGVQPSGPALGGYAPLVGGEAVQIDLRVARIGSRAIAATLDFMLQLVAFAFLEALILNVLGLDSAAQQAMQVVILVLVFIGYPTVSEAAANGRTLGKAAMGLRAAREDGGPLRFRQALVRGLLGAFIEKPGISLGLVPIVCSMASVRGKRLGDLLAGTVVLQVRLPATGGYVTPMPPPLAGWAGTLDLSRFGDGLALQCRQFLGRAGELSDDARERLGAALVSSVQAVVAPPPPPGTPGWAYIAAVLAERRRRDELRHFSGQRAVYAPPGAAVPPPPPPFSPPPIPPPPIPPPAFGKTAADAGPPEGPFAAPG